MTVHLYRFDGGNNLVISNVDHFKRSSYRSLSTDKLIFSYKITLYDGRVFHYSQLEYGVLEVFALDD